MVGRLDERARPKSVTLTAPSGAISKFDGLIVTMDDPMIVGSLKTQRSLAADVHCPANRELTNRPNQISDADRQELHRDEVEALIPTVFQYSDDIRVIDLSGQLCFPAKAFDPVGVGRAARKEGLERDYLPVRRIPRSVNRTPDRQRLSYPRYGIYQWSGSA